MSFNLDDFIAGINQDKQKASNPKDRLNKVLMNTRGNQGTLTFIPIYSNYAKNFYLKVPSVYEYFGDTSLLENSDGAWYKLLPIDWYENLTDEQIELYNEIKGYLDFLDEKKAVSYDEFRRRTYSLFFGICISLKNTEGNDVEDFVDCPCLFIYPSPNPINQLCDAINTKIDVMKGRKEWLSKVLSLDNTGRRGVVQMKFVKATGAGYDCSAMFEMNNTDEGVMVIDPDYEVSDETMKLFDGIFPLFVGWCYDKDNNSAFNEVAMKELRDQLKLRVKSLKNGEPEPSENKEVYENKNNLTPPDTTASAPQKKRPF